MTIPIKIISNEPEQEEMFSITLEARKTLDGKIMIFDHKRIDIVIDLENRKKILINLSDLDGIGNTQIQSLEKFFSNKTNTRIIKNW